MAKRFIDTGLFDDEWFMNLTSEAKILWLYFITKCDHAGILKLNQTLAKVQTGIKDLNKIIEHLGNRIVTVNENIFFVPKFLEYQYPGFPKCNFKAAKSAVEILKKYDLIDNEGNIKIEFNSYITVTKELPNSYGNGIGISNGIGNGISNDLEDEIEFEIFRKNYPGTKRGFKIEFDNFRKHKDWKEVIKILNLRLDYQRTVRAQKEAARQFVPEWKNMKTWINQRCWEEEIPYETNRRNNQGATAEQLAELIARTEGTDR